jgi:hypothetical protein
MCLKNEGMPEAPRRFDYVEAGGAGAGSMHQPGFTSLGSGPRRHAVASGAEKARRIPSCLFMLDQDRRP